MEGGVSLMNSAYKSFCFFFNTPPNSGHHEVPIIGLETDCLKHTSYAKIAFQKALTQKAYAMTYITPDSAYSMYTSISPRLKSDLLEDISEILFVLIYLLFADKAPVARARSPTDSDSVYASHWFRFYLSYMWYWDMNKSGIYHSVTFTFAGSHLCRPLTVEIELIKTGGE